MPLQGIDQSRTQAWGSPQTFQEGGMDEPSPSTGVYTQDTEMDEEGESYEEMESPEEDLYESQITRLMETVNIAEQLTEEQLIEIGNEAYQGFMDDLQSRGDWDDTIDKYTALASQVVEEKSYPWPKASNVKYPLLSTACLQFNARALPSLLPSDKQFVKSGVIGKDPTGKKKEKAERTSKYVSYQLSCEMTGWETDMDKLLMMLPIVGCMFKKTYWDSLNEVNCSHLVMPKNLVVNYWTKNLEDCERISEIIEISPRKLKERQNAGLFLDVDLGSAPMPEHRFSSSINAPVTTDSTTPYTLIEQHTFLDLDDDGYKEPYIVTFHLESRKVVRISARFDAEGIKMSSTGKLIKITPINYYTKYPFFPAMDGSFYDIGFGTLISPLNEAVNTNINQLIDAGTLNNLQSGYIGKGLRIKMGESAFTPGEWKVVNAVADDLRKQIVPLPTKDPSPVLLNLLTMLITSGKELASVAEIFVGKMPGQNTPATTTMASIQEGMKVFTAVYKRIYLALGEEFKKLYRLNRTYLNPETYFEVLDTTIDPSDFSPVGYDILPGADPTAASQSDKLLKAQGLVEMLPLGILNPVQVLIRMLEAQEQPNWQSLIPAEVMQSGQPPQRPDPAAAELQMESQLEQQKYQLEQDKEAFKQQMQQRDQVFKQRMDTIKQQNDNYFKTLELKIDAAAQLHKDRMQMGAHLQSLAQKEQTHMQNMSHQHELQQIKKESSKLAPTKSSGTGKSTP